MLKFSLPVVMLFSCLLSPLAAALELSDLHLPMTRREADDSLSKDYSYRVLEDMTIRRSWSLDNREVSVDFAPKQEDSALLIFIDYTKPVSPAVAAADAAQLIGEKGGKWTKLQASRAERLGMENPEGLKVSGGRFCFRSLNAGGRVTRLAYYASVPGEVRWELAVDDPQSGKTAMGARGGSGGTAFLWNDEERRYSKPLPAVQQQGQAVKPAAVVHDEPETHSSGTELRLDDKKKSASDEMMETLKGVDPMYYGIAAGVVVLLLLVRAVRNAREAKRRKMVADYIMKKGRIAVPAPKKGKR